MSDSTNKITVKIVADTSSLEKGLMKAEVSIGKFNQSISKGMFKAMASFELIKKGMQMVADATVGGTKDAIKFESIMDNLSNKLGDSTKDFENWSESTGRALGFSKLQSAEMANTLSVNLSRVATSQQDLYEKTVKMMEVSAIIRAKTGRSMQDVSERIRSAMNQEADGADELGLNVRTNAIVQSEAYKKMADGKPWSQLGTNMQKTILYYSILEQTSKNFGTTISDNTSLRVAQFSASLADLKLQLGQAFLPIVNTALPYLSALVSAMTKALQYVTLFMETLFGYKHDASKAGYEGDTTAVDGLTNSLAGATAQQEALNKAKKKGGLTSFDEVHTLPEKAGSSTPASSDTGSGLPYSTGGSSEDSTGLLDKLGGAGQKVVEFAEKVKTWMQPIVDIFSKIGSAIKEYLIDKWHELAEWWRKDGGNISKMMQSLWNNVLYPIFSFIVEYIWGDIKGAIDGLIDFFTGLLSFFADIFVGDWEKAWQDLWKCVKGAVEAIWNIIDLVFIVTIGGAIKSALKGFLNFFLQFGDNIVKCFDDLFVWMFNFLKNNWDNIIKSTKGIWDDLVLWFAKLGRRMLSPFKSAFDNIGVWFYDNVVAKITENVGGIVKKFAAIADDAWKALKNSFLSVAKWYYDNVTVKIIDTVTSIISKFKTIGDDAWKAIKGGFSGVGSWFKDNIVDAAIGKVGDLVTKFKTIGSNAWDAMKFSFQKVGTWFFDNIVTPAHSNVTKITSKFTQIGKDAWSALQSPFKSVAEWFKTNVTNKISNVFSGIKLAFDETVFNKVKDFYNDKMRKPVNNAIGGIQKALDWLHIDYQLPKLPALYNGGITNGKMVATIGDNVGGREVVSPLDTLNSIIANTMLQTLKFNGGGAGTGSGGDIVLNIDGRTFARIIQPYQNYETNRMGKNIVMNAI